MYNPQQRKRFLLEIDNPCWIRITMAYTDYPGSSIQNKINLFADLDNKNHSTPNSQKWLGNEGAYRPLGSNIDKANNHKNYECCTRQLLYCCCSHQNNSRPTRLFFGNYNKL